MHRSFNKLYRWIKSKNVIGYCAFCVWLALFLVSLAAMYQLWWTREFRLYGGKSPSEQRLAVIRRAGIPVETLRLAYEADAIWAPNVAYRANGSEVTLSYFKYLMIPRVPSGSDAFSITETKTGEYALAGRDDVNTPDARFNTNPPSPRGLILSFFVVSAVAFLFKRFGFSFPQQVACSALLLYVLTVLIKPLARSFWPVGVLFSFVGLIGVVDCIRRKSFVGVKSLVARFKTQNRLAGFFVSALYVVFAAAVMWAFLMAVVVLPDDWDAWAQWGPKAKLLAVSAGPLSDVKYFVPGSGDYPVLWPAVWAFSGWLSGGWEEQWSKGWGAIFMALAAWQLSVIYWRAGGNRVGGLLFAALFVSSPAVPLVASWGYAEAPYWLMLVCAMSEVLMWRRDKQRKCLWFASFFVAAAASTKNEGIMFAMLCSMWVALCGRNVKDILAISIVPLVFAGVWRVYVAMVIGTSNHALGGFSQAGVDFVVMADMLRYALLYIVRHWLDPRQWNIVMPIALVASLWLAFKGGRHQRVCLLLPFAMLGSLLLVVLLYGENWKWQMYVAWNRLTIQFLAVLFPVLAAGFGAQSVCRDAGAGDATDIRDGVLYGK